MRVLRRAGLVGIVLLGAAGVVQAHHSTTVFDNSKTATVTGIVAKLEWTNPHVVVWVNVPNASDPGRGGLWILGRLANGPGLPSRGGPVSRSRPVTQSAAQAASAQCPRAEVVEVMPKASAQTRPVAYRNGTIHVSRAPLATLADVADVEFDPPWAIRLAFTPEVGERMERITARPDFPMAFVVDNDAVLSVVLQGGFGIGKDGLQISVDRNEERIRKVYDTLSRCVASQSKK